MRSPRVGEHVRVYRNLAASARTGKRVYSVVGSGGLVIARVQKILLTDVTFVVQPAGRDRVRKTGQKNVHAFVTGTVARSAMGGNATQALPCRITYNPYEDEGFVGHAGCRFYISGATACVLNQGGVSAAYTSEDTSKERP